MGDKTATEQEQFSSLLAAKVQILYEKRRRLRVKSDERLAFFVTFVFFLMGIVPITIKNDYEEQKDIVLAVGGGAGLSV